MRPLLILVSLMGSFFLVQTFMWIEQDMIYKVYWRDIAIIRPYISTDNYNQYCSSFARIQSKQEYDALLGKIITVAKAHGITMSIEGLW